MAQPAYKDIDLEADRVRMSKQVTTPAKSRRARSRSRARPMDDDIFVVSEPNTYRLAADALRLQEPYEDEPSVFLTGRARACEFKYREMDKAKRDMFHKAMTQEWTSFQNFDALRPLTKEETDYVKKHNITPAKM